MKTAMQRTFQSFAPIPLRLLVGFAFVFHGYPKLFTADGNGSFAGMLADIGVPWAGLNAYLIGGFEFFGGILLILGVAVRIVSALGIAEMAVAAITVHASAGFNFLNITGMTESGAMEFGMPGYEVNVLYIAAFASLLLSGAGRWSLPSVRGDIEVAAPPRSEAEPMHAGR